MSSRQAAAAPGADIQKLRRNHINYNAIKC